MEPLLKQLRELPKRLAAAPAGVRRLILAGLAIAVLGAAAFAALAGSGSRDQYAFTNLSTEDSAEASTLLKQAGIPFHLEAGGAALAVPSDKLYDARLLLAGAGLPRSGGVGFELFDRGDLGVSEFTQKVNLRRATEGELARTIGHLAGVRSARVHLTFEEDGLYREDQHKASAAVVVNLQPGHVLNDRELAGVRHLVASSVPGLTPEAVSIVDGRGMVLGATDAADGALGHEREVERSLEQRAVAILEPVVGQGEVVARVTAVLDEARVDTRAETVDPDGTALKSERKLLQNQTQDSSTQAGVAGAAANVPLAPTGSAAGAGNRSSKSVDDSSRTYDVSKTTTQTVVHTPRLSRISVAILVDAAQGKPRSDAELKQLGELAKRAVGFDPSRGDQFELTSASFSHSGDASAAPPPAPASRIPPWAPYAALAAAVVLIGAVLLLRRRRPAEAPLLTAGKRVAELEAELSGKAGTVEVNPPAALPDPAEALRTRARELASADPTRAAHLLRAWLEAPAKGDGHG